MIGAEMIGGVEINGGEMIGAEMIGVEINGVEMIDGEEINGGGDRCDPVNVFVLSDGENVICRTPLDGTAPPTCPIPRHSGLVAVEPLSSEKARGPAVSVSTRVYEECGLPFFFYY
jgi:hypothetical protein